MSFKSLQQRDLKNVKYFSYYNQETVLPHLASKRANRSKEYHSPKNSDKSTERDENYFKPDIIVEKSRNSAFNLWESMSKAGITKLNTKNNIFIATQTQIRKTESPEKEKKNEIFQGIDNPDLTSPITNKKYYYRLLKLKSYDFEVKNLEHVRKLVYFDQSIINNPHSYSMSKSLSPRSIKQHTLHGSSSRNLPRILNKNSSVENVPRKHNIVFKTMKTVSPSHRRNNSEVNAVARDINNITKKFTNGNHQTIKRDDLLEKFHKNQDRHRLELLKIYKTTPEEEEFLKKVY